ncbi:MAG: hypothetical protein KCHDKBKB_01766 [Elusimicrobia bacterium]|nr:hypothetical protein [Elusimicrobiota bacterium]
MEALLASMLPPEEFGAYMAIGIHQMSRGKIVYLELADDFHSKDFDLERGRNECKPDEFGAPKKSVYLSLYRVIERIPMEFLRTIHLVTKDGRDLAIAPQKIQPTSEHPHRGGVFFYQELAPVRPMVVSQLDPLDFGQFLTDGKNPLRLPKILYARMKLGRDPLHVLNEPDLPYGNLPHLQNCIQELVDAKKVTKTYERYSYDDFVYSAIVDGVYLAEQGQGLFYPFPDEADLKGQYYTWWRSAF